MEVVEARLDIEVFVNCPSCGFFIDLLREEDTDGYAHNDEGQILNQACPNGNWSEEHKGFEVEEVICTQCKTPFGVKGLEW
jgi:hypothetical protein